MELPLRLNPVNKCQGKITSVDISDKGCYFKIGKHSLEISQSDLARPKYPNGKTRKFGLLDSLWDAWIIAQNPNLYV